MATKIITLSEVTKRFRRRIVLSEISLNIYCGDSIAFIGRNGCGKSTLLKIAAGLMPFEKGKVTHHGKLKFGYVPERFPALNLTATEYLIRIGMVSGLSKNKAMRHSEEKAEALHMQGMMDTPIRFLSKGTLQKVAVVQAFLTLPDVLLLDEPISGQDMASQRAFVEMVNSLNRTHGVTVLCSCHEDYIVKAIASSVYEIEEGKLHKVEQSEDFDFNNLCRLLFVKKDRNCENNIAVPKFVNDESVKMEQLESGEVAIYVMPSISDRIIREMLSENFELRGLNDERIYF